MVGTHLVEHAGEGERCTAWCTTVIDRVTGMTGIGGWPTTCRHVNQSNDKVQEMYCLLHLSTAVGPLSMRRGQGERGLGERAVAS